MMHRLRGLLIRLSTRRTTSTTNAPAERRDRGDDVMPVNPYTAYPTSGSSGPAF